jgi:hypothetical protein
MAIPSISITSAQLYAQQPLSQEPPVQIYPQLLYSLADFGPNTLASHTSKNSSLEHISVLFTHAIKHVLDEYVRKPIALMTKRIQALKPSEVIFKQTLNSKDFPELKSLYPQGDTIEILATISELRVIVGELKEYLRIPEQRRPGKLLSFDLLQRVLNILSFSYPAEMACLSWIEEVTAPALFSQKSHFPGTLCTAIATAAFYKALSSGFDITKTQALETSANKHQKVPHMHSHGMTW